MSSGIWISAGLKGRGGTPFLPEQEAECHVSDGEIIALVTWHGVPIGRYNDVRIRSRTWRRETSIEVEPVTLHGSTVKILVTCSFPDET